MKNRLAVIGQKSLAALTLLFGWLEKRLDYFK